MINVDARGCSCPEPVIMTKKVLKEVSDEVIVLVDNKVALENVKRFAVKNGYQVRFEEIDDYYKIILNK